MVCLAGTGAGGLGGLAKAPGSGWVGLFAGGEVC